MCTVMDARHGWGAAGRVARRTDLAALPAVRGAQVIGAVNVGCTVIAVLVVDRFGRRFLLVEGGIQCCIMMIIVGEHPHCCTPSLPAWRRRSCRAGWLFEGATSEMPGRRLRLAIQGPVAPSIGRQVAAQHGPPLGPVPSPASTHTHTHTAAPSPAGVVLGVEFSAVAGTILPKPVARGVLAVICEHAPRGACKASVDTCFLPSSDARY